MDNDEYRKMINEIDEDIKRYRSEFLTLKEIQFIQTLKTVMDTKGTRKLGK